ncbi:hypothetical protein GCM10011385_37940 [Nitratireductor aestuarii]|uniref:Uncharacterized protein n=1 Tax=Nitratireductor aestuarii TaxID=1735103 RepID=A0A916S2R2_9HYPH|nr:hypothetical protein GCM10011385_37940 [Nitratireductor aestuarii]
MAMLLHGIDIGFVQQGFVDVRLVSLHALNKLILTHHARSLPKRKTCPQSDWNWRDEPAVALTACIYMVCPGAIRQTDRKMQRVKTSPALRG